VIRPNQFNPLPPNRLEWNFLASFLILNNYTANLELYVVQLREAVELA
jgi:hypothetical protein